MTVQERVDRIIPIIEDDQVSLKLFLITRHLKQGVRKTARMIDKHSYTAHSVDISPPLRNYFVNIVKCELERISRRDDYELTPYSVITDDLGNQIHTYAPNQQLSFIDMLNKQILANGGQALGNLNEIGDSLWAYSVRFLSQGETIYSFRKMSAGKVASESGKKGIRAILSNFDTNDVLLTDLTDNLITFDEKVDALLVDDEFLILHKPGFEAVVGLEEEFKQAASELIESLNRTGLVDGLDVLSSALNENRTILKSISYIARSGSVNDFDREEIDRMSNVLQQLEGRSLRRSDTGNIVLEDANDIKDFIRLLGDYYKQGMVSKRFYGSHGGQIVTPRTP